MNWKGYGRVLREYASEMLGTAFLVFCVVVYSWVMLGDTSPVPNFIPSHTLRLFIAGTMIGISVWLFSLSPGGRYSGGHVNPAITIGFFILGKMRIRDLIGYLAAQMAGGALGVYGADALFRRLSDEVNFAFLSPVHGLSSSRAFLYETAGTFLLAVAIFACLGHRKLVRWTPIAAALMSGLIVSLDGSRSGAGINPARWFGPALELDNWHLAWVYIAGPVLGGIAAGLIGRRPIVTELIAPLKAFMLRPTAQRMDRARIIKLQRAKRQIRFHFSHSVLGVLMLMSIFTSADNFPISAKRIVLNVDQPVLERSKPGLKPVARFTYRVK